MTDFLDGRLVLTLGRMQGRALANLLESFGARIEPFDPARLVDADFLVEDLGLPAMEAMDFPRSRLQELNPSLIHVSVTTFGSIGPRSHWRGGELAASATSGILRLTGTPDSPPVKEALDACTYHADMAAGAGAMAAFLARARHGSGQHVDVSIQEVAFSRNTNSILVWQFDKRKLSRVGAALNYGKATVRCIWKLVDGWCFHSLMTGRFGAPANRALSEWITEVGMSNPMTDVDWLTYDRSTLPADTRAIWEKAISGFFESRTKEDIRVEGRRRGINACIVATPEDVLKEPHLADRGFWTEVDGKREPGRFVSVVDGPAGKPPMLASGTRSGPLTGVKVLDFSWALVGSITTKTMGDLGADVIKVESASRPCLSRIDVQVSASSRASMDDKPWFAHLNTSKRSLALDLKAPESREVLDELIRWADVVVENFSPGTMDKLGLGYDQLKVINPGIVMVSGSVYGQTGEMSQEWGVDGTGGALSGRTYLTGWADGGPLVPGAAPYGDVIVPYVMAAAAAAAIERRSRTGQGAHVDASMYEICVQQMRRAFFDVQDGKSVERMGNASPDMVYQDVLPCLGDDKWVAVSCETDSDLDRLKAIAGTGDLAVWTKEQDAETLEVILQEAGIAAVAVRDIEDIFEREPQLQARGSLVEVDHSLLGPFGHVRTPMLFSHDSFAPAPAPAIGAHSREIAIGEAGLSPERVDELFAKGLFR